MCVSLNSSFNVIKESPHPITQKNKRNLRAIALTHLHVCFVKEVEIEPLRKPKYIFGPLVYRWRADPYPAVRYCRDPKRCRILCIRALLVK